MKHARKMIMIPEDEYQALIRLLTKSGDTLQNEKIGLDAKISSTLADPDLEPDIKQKKYNTLYKQRRHLKEIIENKPQKVVIENMPQASSNIPPYLGISQGNPTKLSETKSPESVDTEIESTYRTPLFSEEETPKTSNIHKLPRITPKQHKKILQYVSRNLDIFGVEFDGRIRSYKNLPIKNSNYKKALDYMAGITNTTPPGLMFFSNALKKDHYTSQILGMQTGKGRKVLVKIFKKGIIKTPGIKRTKHLKFKPQLWAKL